MRRASGEPAVSAGRLWGCLDDERADARQRVAERKFACYMWKDATETAHETRG